MLYINESRETPTNKQKEFLQSFNNTVGDREAVPACEENCEGWFSWSRCDTCGSGLGGERHPVVFFAKRTADKLGEGECCVDCLCYMANGDLPQD